MSGKTKGTEIIASVMIAFLVMAASAGVKSSMVGKYTWQ